MLRFSKTSLSRLLFPMGQVNCGKGHAPRAHLQLEILEDRTVPTVITPFDDVAAFSINTNGEIDLIGNTLLQASGNPINNNTLPNGASSLVFVDVDDDNSTFNSSDATLILPNGSSVLWAGLYWGAFSGSSSRNQVLFDTPDTPGYQSLTGSVVGASGSNYQGFADVTALVQAGGTGTYTIANVQANQQQSGRYAGWALVVVLEDPTAPLRNLTVFDGYAVVDSGTPTVPLNISGFVTPAAGTFNTSIGVVAYDGDRGLPGTGFRGDQFKLENTFLSDAQHPVDDFFNSTISKNGARFTNKNRDIENQLGIDASIVDASGILANGATSATITLSTNGERYFPGVVTTAIDLFQPVVEGDQAVTDVNGNNVRAGDVLDYVVQITNSGNDVAQDLTLTNPIPLNAVYELGSLEIIQGNSPGVKSDTVGDDEAEFDSGQIVFRLGNLGIGDTTTLRFRLRIDPGSQIGDQIENLAILDFIGATTQEVLQSISVADAQIVTQINLAPIILPESNIDVIQDTPMVIDVLANDSDPDGDTLTISDLAQALNGQIAITLDNKILYTPNNGFLGADSFGYTVTDGQGTFGSASVSLNVIPPPNSPPVAVRDILTITGGSSRVLPVLANDFDPDGDALSISSVTQPLQGTLVLQGGNNLIYTPNGNFLGLDQFNYQLTDGKGGFATGSASLNVLAPPFAAVADTFTVQNTGAASVFKVLANDIFAPNTGVSISDFSATRGTLELSSDGTSLIYRAPLGFTGQDTISYTLSDIFGRSSTTSVTVQVLPGAPGLTGTTAVAVDTLSNLILPLGNGNGAGEQAGANLIQIPGLEAVLPGGSLVDRKMPESGAGMNDAIPVQGNSQISGIVFTDDGDGVQAVQEAGMNRRKIILEVEKSGIFIPVRSMLTDADGSFTFDKLAPGKYRVRYLNGEGELLSTPISGAHVVVLGNAEHVEHRSFGVVPSSSAAPGGEEAGTPNPAPVPEEESKEENLDLFILDTIFGDPYQLEPTLRELIVPRKSSVSAPVILKQSSPKQASVIWTIPLLSMGAITWSNPRSRPKRQRAEEK